MPESVRYRLSRGEVAEAERTVADIERQALAESKPAPAAPVSAAVQPAPRGVTVFELFEDGRARRTILLWIVSFCFLWSSYVILFLLPTILYQRGIVLCQSISF